MEFDEVTRFAAADPRFVVGSERGQVRRTGSDKTVQIAIRVTTVLRRKDDGWLGALRHAETITAPARTTTFCSRRRFARRSFDGQRGGSARP